MSEGKSEKDKAVHENEALRCQIAALEVEAQRLKAILYGIGDAVISTDADGNVVQLNHVAETLTGWSEVEAKGRPTPEVFKIVNEETRSEVESPIARVLREGVVVGLANHALLIAKDGTERPIADSGVPIRDEKGEITGVGLVFRDQTEERATQKALRESEVRNRAIVASIPQKLFLKDRNCVYLAVNEAYATSLGSKPEQVVGKDDFAFYPAELAEKYRADDRAVMESARVKDVEERYLAQGKEYWVHTTKAPVADDRGEVTAVLGLFEDITERKRVEDSLKDARDRLNEVQRAARLGNWEWDAVEDQISGSEEFYRLFDVAPDELMRFSQFVERLHPDDRERVQREVADALKQDRPYDTDYRVKLRDCGWRDIIARGRVITGVDGKPVRMVGTCLDITERKRMENELRESQQSLHRSLHELDIRDRINSVFLTVPGDEMYAKVLDIVLEIMDSKYGVFGYLDDAGAHVDPTLNPTVWAECQVADKQRIFPRASWGQSSWPRAYQEKRTICVNEVSTLTPKGHIAITRHISHPLMHQGEPIGLIQVANKEKDYTPEDVAFLERLGGVIAPVLDARLKQERSRLARQNAEESLLKSEEGFRILFNHAADAIFLLEIGSEGMPVIRDANNTTFRLLGYERDELIGQPVSFIDAAPDASKVVEARRRNVISGATIFEASHRCKDGTVRDFECSATEMQIGSKMYAISVERDITERNKLAGQLRMSQKMEAIGSLAGGVAHDFNNLLSVILSYTGLAMDAVRDGDPLKDDLLEVKKAAERAVALTRQLLAFSRKQILLPEPLDLNQTAAGVEKMLRRILGEDIDYVQVLAPDLGLTLADPGQIEQVIMNLVVNARDAMPEGGKLTIETSNVDIDEEYAAHHVAVKTGPYVQLVITDTGCGIDEKTRARLFEPFFTTKEKGKGTGLGLSTVYGIVKQSGGNIWVYSEPGQGTTFKIYLPRELAATTSTAIKPAPIPTPSRGTETILVVEDEEALRKVAKRSLEKAGFRVLTAADGDDALLTSAQHAGDIHLLLTDVVMPRMSGRALAQELSKARPTLLVVYMSGYTDDAIVHHGVLDAGTHFLAKPFTSSDLTRKVREVLDGGMTDHADGHEQAIKPDNADKKE